MALTNNSAKKAVWDKLTPEEQDCADFLAILMFVAKSLEEVRATANMPLEDAIWVALENQRTVLRLAHRLYPRRDEMEARVIAFADRLGFDIGQQYFPVHSNAIH